MPLRTFPRIYYFTKNSLENVNFNNNFIKNHHRQHGGPHEWMNNLICEKIFRRVIIKLKRDRWNYENNYSQHQMHKLKFNFKFNFHDGICPPVSRNFNLISKFSTNSRLNQVVNFKLHNKFVEAYSCHFWRDNEDLMSAIWAEK